MTEPTAASVDPTSWQEARPPHLPDTLTGIPRLVWPFVALAGLVAVVQWHAAGGSIWPFAAPDPETFLWVMPPVATALIGAALFWRHPVANREFPRLAIGVTAFVVASALEVLVNPATSAAMTELDPVDMGVVVILSTLARVPLMVLGIIGLLWMARGLDDAPRLRAVTTGRAVTIAAVVAIAAWTLLTLGSWPLVQAPADDDPRLILAAAIVVVLNALWLFAIARLIGASVRGWLGGATPRFAWALVAASGAVTIGAAIVFTTMSVVASLWLVDFSATFWVSGLLPVLSPLCLLAAFALGLPVAAVVAPPAAAADSPFEEDRTVRIG